MAEAIFLGTGHAVPSLQQENTYIALAGEHHTVLIDCGGSPYRQALRANLDLSRLDVIILTHFHPDHVYGLPALLLALCLTGRQAPLKIYALPEISQSVQAMLALYHPEQWPAMFALSYHVIAPEPGTLVLNNSDFQITAAPVKHVIPTIGLRVLNHLSGNVLAYSSDTEPCHNVQLLAQNASLLIHEATGARPGHSSAAQAGVVAQKAGVRQLVLVHYDAQATPPEALKQAARRAFTGQVSVAQDFDHYPW